MLQIMSDSNTNTTNFLTVLIPVKIKQGIVRCRFFVCSLIALLYTKSFRIEIINFILTQSLVIFIRRNKPNYQNLIITFQNKSFRSTLYFLNKVVQPKKSNSNPNYKLLSAKVIGNTNTNYYA